MFFAVLPFGWCLLALLSRPFPPVRQPDSNPAPSHAIPTSSLLSLLSSRAEDADLDEGLAERLRILGDARSLKILAVAYLHPEKGIFNRHFLLEGTDPAVFGRNYFNRHSAPDAEEFEVAEERARVLAEAAALKKAAAEHMHPEVGVASADGACFGRNYFERYSAPETEDDELADERVEIMDEMAALKKLAVDYLHPEVGVKAADATLFGRNYFHRYSAPETEEFEVADERARVLAEAAALKKSAVDYLHPEVGVKAADATLFGRNYFNRYSAPETEDDELADERAEIMDEMATLKKLAVDYLHPEVGVKAADATLFGRNYFNRYSAPETEDEEVAEEGACVLAEAAALKKLAMDYMHPEVGVTSTDSACFGRNYFMRYSAPEVEDEEVADERAEILEDAAALKRLAAVVKGANLPNIKSAKLSSSDSNVGATKKSASTVNLFGLSEEVF